MTEKQIPRPEQQERVERFLAEPTGAALLADEPGVGKTLVAVEIARQFERVLFVGIKDTFGQFADRLESQSDGAILLRRIDSTKAGRAAFADMLAGEPGHYFSGSEMLTAQDWTHEPVLWDDGTPKMVVDKKTGLATEKQESRRIHLNTYKKMKPMDLIVFDESHKIQNRQAIGLRTIRTIKTAKKLAMSGTPGGNTAAGLWAPTRWLWPDLIDPSFNRWRDRYLETKEVYAKGGRAVTTVVGEKMPGEFVSGLPLFIRAEAKEQPPEPELIYVDLSPAQRQQYETLEEDLILWVESKRAQGIEPLIADAPIVLRQRLRTATLGELSLDEGGAVNFDMDCKSSKLVALRGLLDHWGDQPVIIGCDSKQFAKITAERMRAAGYGAILRTGDTPTKQRDDIKARFLAKDPAAQYLVVTIQSFSTGLDGYQSVCSKVAWLNEVDGNPVENEQYIKRTFRPGRTLEHGPFQHVKLIARDTFDEGIMTGNLAKHLALRASLRAA